MSKHKHKHYRKYAITTMAAAAMVASIAPVVSAAESSISFSDVRSGNVGYGAVGVHYDAIMGLANEGVISGNSDGNFNPWKNIYRGQVAKMFVEAKNLDIPSNVEEVLAVYDDVDANNDYAAYIAAATEAGIYQGSNGKFNEYTFISREQMASILVRAFHLDGQTVDEGVDIDLDRVSDTHKGAIQTLANLGLTTELSNFRAYENIDRAAFSTLLYRTMDKAISVVSGVQGVTPTSTPTAPEDLHHGVLQNDIAITYKQPMGSSAIDKSNYTLDGSALPDDTKMAISKDKKRVTLALPEGYLETARDQRLRISSDIQTIDGRFIVANESTEAEFTAKVALADNTQPIIEKAEYLVLDLDNPTETNRVLLTFSEELAYADLEGVASDLSVVYDNTEVSIAEVVVDFSELIIELEDEIDISNTAEVSVIPEGNDNESMQITDVVGNHAKAVSVDLKNKVLDEEQIYQNNKDMAEAQAIVDRAAVTTSNNGDYTDVTLSQEPGLVWLNRYDNEVPHEESIYRKPNGQPDQVITVTASATVNNQTAQREVEYTVPSIKIINLSIENPSITGSVGDDLESMIRKIGIVTETYDDLESSTNFRVIQEKYLSTDDDLSTPGEKTVTVTIEGVSATFTITLS